MFCFSIIALAAQEDVTTPGEFAGNFGGALLIYAFGWDDDIGDPSTARGAGCLIALNLLRYTLAYGTAYTLFYQLQLGKSHKFNPKYGEADILRRELMRWCCSVIIGTLYDVALRCMLATGGLPPLASGPLLTVPSVAILGGCVLFADLHFYTVHRILHTRTLYKHIHSSHHQSRNPNPISGLSFHPIEGAVYFSSLPVALKLCALAAVPLDRFHYCVLKSLLDFNPIWGHTGFGGPFGGSYHHYIHHERGFRLHVNFGGTWLFDGLFGTGLVVPRPTKAA